MANIKNELNNIKNAMYGKDVRSSIHDGINAINNEVESTTSRQVDLENTFDQLIINAGNSNAEIVDARVKSDGTSYSKLGDRLNEVDSQLAQNVNLIETKRDKNIKINNSDLDVSSDDTKIKLINLSEEVKNAITGNASLSPTLDKFSINRENINLLNTDILSEKEIISNNLFNKNDVKEGYSINAKGELYLRDNSFTTNYIKIKPNTKYTTNLSNASFYDLEGNFISQLNDGTFTTPVGVVFIRLIGDTSLLNNYSLCEGNVIVNDEYAYKLNGINVDEDIAKLTKNISILDTIKNVNLSVSQYKLKVFIEGTSNYNSTFYVYKNNKLTNTIKTSNLNEEYELSQWQSLVLDLNTNEIKIVSENVSQNNNNYIVLITHSINGIGLNGFLAEKYSIQKSLNMYNSYNDMIKTTNLYIENRFDNCDIKFDSILINRGSFYKEYDFAKVKEDLSNYLYQSTEWVEECLRLIKGFVLVFNTKEEKFKVATLGNFTTLDDIMLCFNNNGIAQGLLIDCKNSNEITSINTRANRIDSKYLNKIEEKENLILSELNCDDFVFGFSTDTHSENSNNTLPNLVKLVMNRVCEIVNVDAILNGGDSVAYGKANKNESVEDLKNAINGFYDKTKILHAIGNHDFNGVSNFDGFDGKERKSWLITKKEVYRIVQSHLSKDKNVHFGSKEDLYFYKDFEDKKIRIIVLNTSDLEEIWENDGEGEYLKYTPLKIGGIRQKQLEWFSNVALNFNDKENKEEWHTMVLCHIGLYSNSEGLTWNFPKVENKNVVRDIIANFISGGKKTLEYVDTEYEGMFNSNINVDFTNQGGMPFIGVFSGHNHLDRIIKDNKLNQITTTCGYPDASLVNIEPTNIREPLTYSEFAFDIVKIDKANRIVRLYRFGAGEDREFSY